MKKEKAHLREDEDEGVDVGEVGVEDAEGEEEEGVSIVVVVSSIVLMEVMLVDEAMDGVVAVGDLDSGVVEGALEREQICHMMSLGMTIQILHPWTTLPRVEGVDEDEVVVAVAVAAEGKAEGSKEGSKVERESTKLY